MTLLPIAETFHSIQGEGTWVGAPMHFIRLAGCPVGRPAKAVKWQGPLQILPTGEEAKICTSWDGRSFPCDTDYNQHDRKTVDELLDETYEDRICLTGGEPLIHDLQELVDKANGLGKRIHIETSGTIMPKIYLRAWITVAPKVGCLADMVLSANEIRILVDLNFHPDELTPEIKEHPNVFLCPINDVTTINRENINLCLKWLKLYPKWRLSCQLHKFLSLP